MKILSMMITGHMIAGLLMATSPASAQQVPAQPHEAAPPPGVCESDDRFNQFDFWLGTWRVTSRADGSFQGTNRITKAQKNCLIHEHCTSKAGGTGSSVNYFNPNNGKWRQVWVSNGYSLDITGNYMDDAMVLTGQIDYYKTGKSFPFKGTWSREKDGTVRQLFHQHDPETDRWVVWFDGSYSRVKD